MHQLQVLQLMQQSVQNYDFDLHYKKTELGANDLLTQENELI